MEYAILDELKYESDQRLEAFLAANPGVYATSTLMEVEEPFEGSDPNTRLFIYSNYMSKTGLINLAIIIKETKDSDKENEEFLSVASKVECSIFPLYLTKTPIYDMPEKVESPDITEERAKFIIEKRTLPKMGKGETFDPTKHKWSVNKIAAELNMSNRLVAQYCKAHEGLWR